MINDVYYKELYERSIVLFYVCSIFLSFGLLQSTLVLFPGLRKMYGDFSFMLYYILFIAVLYFVGIVVLGSTCNFPSLLLVRRVRGKLLLNYYVFNVRCLFVRLLYCVFIYIFDTYTSCTRNCRILFFNLNVKELYSSVTQENNLCKLKWLFIIFFSIFIHDLFLRCNITLKYTATQNTHFIYNIIFKYLIYLLYGILLCDYYSNIYNA